MTKIEPAISLPIEMIEVPGRKDCYVIGIHADGAKFGDAPYTYDGRAFYKVESTTKLMPRSMFEERLRRSNPNRFAWESQTPDTLHFEDLDAGVDYPQFLLRMARFRGTEKDSFIDNMRVRGNFFELLDAGMSFFFKHLLSLPIIPSRSIL